MNRNIVYKSIILVSIIMVEILLFHEVKLFAAENSLADVKTKEQVMANYYKDLSPMIIRSNTYDEENKLIGTGEMFYKHVERLLRINYKDLLRRGETYSLISNNSRIWQNKGFFFVPYYIVESMLVLAGQSRAGVILEQETDILKTASGKQYVVISILFDKIKIIVFADPDSLIFHKMQAFYMQQDKWVRFLEAYFAEFKEIKKASFATQLNVYLYQFDGSRQQQNMSVYSIETNKDIDAKIFEIPSVSVE